MRSTPKAAGNISRRHFCAGTASVCGAALLSPTGIAALAQIPASPGSTPTKPDVAAIDRERILAATARYLNLAPTPLTSLRCERSPGTPHDYYSESEPVEDAESAPAAKTKTALPPPFTAHRDAVFTLGLAVPVLAAAQLLTGEDRYAAHAALWLRAWFVDPVTRMTPRMDFGQVAPPKSEHEPPSLQRESNTPSGRFEGILETVPLVEVALAIPFLARSPALTESDRSGIVSWFAEYLRWLTAPQDSGPRLAALARDQKDHHGSSWLLQVTAYSLLTAPPGTTPTAEGSAFTELRHRFRSVTLRAQIGPDGSFPHELPSSAPYRNSLFNLDLLAGVCQLLSTRFDSVWDYELEDGPGMRSAIAYHFPFIADRALWPFRADSTHFDQLPGRRASLLFTARAYQRPEYAALWRKLPPDPPALEIQRTMPIHQPLLWVQKSPRTSG